MELNKPSIEDLPGLRSTIFGYFINNTGVEVRLKADSHHLRLYTNRGYKYMGDKPTQFDHREPLPKEMMDELIERSRDGEPSEVFKCETCGKECENATALGCHKRVHQRSMRKKKK